MSQNGIKAAESYLLEGIGRQNLDAVPLHPEIRFRGPLHTQAIVGKEALDDYLGAFYPIVKEVRILKRFADGENVCIEWELELTQPATTIPILEYFRIQHGQLTEIRPYYDPRPVIG